MKTAGPSDSDLGSPMDTEPSNINDERMYPLHRYHEKIIVKYRYQAIRQAADDTLLEEPKHLIPLTALKWPYIPDESAYPDPLKRDDPKTLQLHQYEAICTRRMPNIPPSHAPSLILICLHCSNLAYHPKGA
jgi:hypothetical protein